uniref:Uncharacterized protein n=1 Tax=Romanomermis culicivorax TaxID=13658 RepID=A0A915KG94_ROMCU
MDIQAAETINANAKNLGAVKNFNFNNLQDVVVASNGKECARKFISHMLEHCPALKRCCLVYMNVQTPTTPRTILLIFNLLEQKVLDNLEQFDIQLLCPVLSESGPNQLSYQFVVVLKFLSMFFNKAYTDIINDTHKMQDLYL